MDENIGIYFDEEAALSDLLKEGILFCNYRFYSRLKEGKSDGQTIVLFVVANDVFAYACADAEDLPLTELHNLYTLWKNHGPNGVIKWLAIQRNEKPLNSIVENLKKSGLWDSNMEKLCENQCEMVLKLTR